MGIYYSIGFLTLFLVCLVLEFFVPSAGLIGASAFVAAFVAIVLAFGHSVTAGATVSVVVLFSTPAILYLMIRMWPHTPIGRRILNRIPGQPNDDHAHTLADGTPIDELVGRDGVAVSDLLPSGRVLIDGRKLDAVSIGMAIDAGSRVVVTKIVSRKIQVKIADNPSPNASLPNRAGDNSPDGSSNDLATEQTQPLKSFDLESFD